MKQELIFTVDIEDWYQVENLKGVISRKEWSCKESRVVENTEKILDILDACEANATFFVLGDIAEKFPDLVKKTYKRGYEIASHGYGHELIYNQTFEEFRKDVRRSKCFLEDCIGNRVLGYRAPSFSITDWALDILKEEGFRYDSSCFPFSLHNRYGRITKPFTAVSENVMNFDNGLIEFQLPVVHYFGMKIPFGGGGYFRAIPYLLFNKGIKQVLRKREEFVFYIHPWEIDYDQPKVKNIKLSYRFRCYINLKTTLVKLCKLSNEFHFTSIRSKMKNLEIL